MTSAAPVPTSSQLWSTSTRAWFVDCFARQLPAQPGLTALAAYQRMSAATPGWVNRLIGLRDALVRPFKLKAVAGFNQRSPHAAPQVGDSLDFFRIHSLSDQELVLALNDSHLDVLISVHLDPQQRISLTSIVEPHNLLGRVYMRSIAPFHRWVVQAMLKRL